MGCARARTLTRSTTTTTGSVPTAPTTPQVTQTHTTTVSTATVHNTTTTAASTTPPGGGPAQPLSIAQIVVDQYSMTFQLTCLQSGYCSNYTAQLGYSSGSTSVYEDLVPQPAKRRKPHFVVLGASRLKLQLAKRTHAEVGLDGTGCRLLAHHRGLRLELRVERRVGPRTTTVQTRKVTFHRRRD